MPTAPLWPQKTNPLPAGTPKLKFRTSDFSSVERSNFLANFEARYKPAIEKWAKAFEGHIPIDPKQVTADNFIERVGPNPSFYSEYVFVVDGITLGVEDSRGTARVDYLNAAHQTAKLAIVPDGSQAPITSAPVAREEITRMLEADGGVHYAPQEIRVIPSGMSGSLNGGAFVNVGGDPNKGGTWKYDMVFGPDGKLAYFLRGIH
jgi:hypothetical protein